MRQTRLVIGVVALMFFAATIVPGAQTKSDTSAEVAFRAALQQETVKGDLKAAIHQYQNVMTAYPHDRSVAAKALLHIGECYEKLGQSEAHSAYERLLRDYADQSDQATEARVHLVALGRDLRATQPGRQTTTLVFAGEHADGEGDVSPDGRYISYPTWDTGNLAVHDFVTGKDRSITTAGMWKNGEEAYAEVSVFSRDGKQIAYDWYEKKTNRYDLRVANLTGDPNPHKIFDSGEMQFVAPDDWSPDGKWIAVHLEPEDSDARTGQPVRPGMQAAMGLLGVQDGSLRVLKTTDWSDARSRKWKALFSPDGKYLAYDWTTGSSNGPRGVYAMELASGREFPVAVSTGSDQLAAWSPDGKRILFTSKRTGAIGLWAIPFTSGAPQGQPELLKPDFGSMQALRMTSAGALYYFVGPSMDLPGIRVAGFDMATGKLTSQPAALAGDTSGDGSLAPTWSQDGKRLAYVSVKSAGSGLQFSTKVYAMDSGEIRELHPGLLRGMGWAPDDRSLLVINPTGLYRVDVQSGEATMLATRPKKFLERGPIEFSRDGTTVYFTRQDDAERTFLALNLASGKEREIIRRANLGGLNLSPDGRYLATASIDPTDHARTFLIIPVDGGVPHEVTRVTGETEAVAQKNFKDAGINVLAWAPDSKSVLFRKSVGPNVELWQGFVDGSESRRINEKLKPQLAQGRIRLSPDGLRVALEVSTTEKRAPSEIMVLDNFLPPTR